MAALADPAFRVPQDPRYRGYWYDEGSHSLVGMHLGLDLNRHGGRYHFLESNLDAAMAAARRELYGGDLDPIVAGFARLAEAHGFERVVLLRRRWSEAHVEEFKRATRETGVEVVGANLAAGDTEGYPSVNPMVALPERLAPRTVYAVCSRLNDTPLFHFVHDKVWAGRWLAEAMAGAGSPSTPLLACVPTFDRLLVPPEPPDGRWPNLVVKLADVDQARAIAMGRFRTEEEARRGLRLEDGPAAIPGVFRTKLAEKLLHAAFRGRAEVIYQPFIPPEVVEGRARRIRLHVFVSPLADAFLSAHGVVAGRSLPDSLPHGLVDDSRAYVVNFPQGGRYCRLEAEREAELREAAREYCRLEAEREAELREAAREFGRLAGLAIRKKFLVSP